MTATPDRGFSGLIGVGRTDVTPKLDVYARCWGAAETDRMAGIHRPLTATALAFAQADHQRMLILVSLDGSWWQADDEWAFRRELLERFSLEMDQLMVGLSHSHAAPPLNTHLSEKPGGPELAEYTRNLADRVAPAIEQALSSLQPGFLTVRTGHCDLASNRDSHSGPAGIPLVGYSPGAPADSCLLALRLTDTNGRILAIGANYACHPTTLGFENNQFSPDFVGAFRETVETAHPGSLAFFLQGASGELAPPYQYHGDTGVADAYGQKLAYSTLAALAGSSRLPSQLRFEASVRSGADLAMWRPEPIEPDSRLDARVHTFRLPLKGDFPTEQELRQTLGETSDEALRERIQRKIGLRRALGASPDYQARLWIWRLGDLLIASAPFEAYSDWQTVVRNQFPDTPIALMNLVNGSPGYLPPDSAFEDARLYTVWQTPFARGGLETLIEQTKMVATELLHP